MVMMVLSPLSQIALRPVCSWQTLEQTAVRGWRAPQSCDGLDALAPEQPMRRPHAQDYRSLQQSLCANSSYYWTSGAGAVEIAPAAQDELSELDPLRKTASRRRERCSFINPSAAAHHPFSLPPYLIAARSEYYCVFL